MKRAKVPNLSGAKVSLRQIEDASPCWTEYRPFLKAMGLRPIADSRFAHSYDMKFKGAARVKENKISDDEPIDVSFIFGVGEGVEEGRGVVWVNWLFDTVPSLEKRLRGKRVVDEMYDAAGRRSGELQAELRAAIDKLQDQFDEAQKRVEIDVWREALR